MQPLIYAHGLQSNSRIVKNWLYAVNFIQIPETDITYQLHLKSNSSLERTDFMPQHFKTELSQTGSLSSDCKCFSDLAQAPDMEWSPLHLIPSSQFLRKQLYMHFQNSTATFSASMAW